VRQALRGRVFRIAFLLVSTGSVIAAVAIAATGSAALAPPEQIGRQLFDFIVIALFATCLVQVPFGAFQSLASEWDEDTYDLLAMTNLRPRRIVLGKLFGALLQAALHLCALTPAIVLAFLMRGVGVIQIAVLVGAIAILCAAYSAVGIALASLSRVRIVRGLLQAAFALAAVFTSIGLYEGLGNELLFRGMRGRDAVMIFTLLAAACVAVLFLGIEVAAARLAHAEENRSSGLRIVIAGAVLAAFAWLHAMMVQFGYGHEQLTYGSMALASLGALLSSSLVTERDALGRRVRLEVPRSALAARLAAPFLPGGARGMLFVALGFALVLAYYLSTFFTHASAIRFDAGNAWTLLVCGPFGILLDGTMGLARIENHDTGPLAILVWLSWLWLVLAVSRRIARFVPTRLRGVSVLLPTMVALLVIVVPIFVGLAFGDRDLEDGEHFGNPAWLVSELEDGSSSAVAGSSLVVLAAFVSLLFHVRTFVAAIREVAAASARLRAHGGGGVHSIAEGVASDARAAS
jgi:hypothetical protein